MMRRTEAQMTDLPLILFNVTLFLSENMHFIQALKKKHILSYCGQLGSGFRFKAGLILMNLRLDLTNSYKRFIQDPLLSSHGMR